jgi:hypothetical protein
MGFGCRPTRPAHVRYRDCWRFRTTGADAAIGGGAGLERLQDSETRCTQSSNRQRSSFRAVALAGSRVGCVVADKRPVLGGHASEWLGLRDWHPAGRQQCRSRIAGLAAKELVIDRAGQNFRG